MAVTTTKTNKPINPRGNDQSPLAFNRAKLYSGKALDFDGVNDSVTTQNISIQSSNTWAIVSNIYIDSSTAVGYFFDAREDAFDGYGIYMYNSGLTNYFDNNGGHLLTHRFPINQYFNIAVIRNGSDVSFYENGVLVETITSSATYSVSGDFYIGQRFSGTDALKMKMGGFKAFNVALTAAQVSDLYNNPEKIVPTGVSNDALKLWLPMMEGAGTTAYDGSSTENGPNLIVNGDFATDSDWTKGTGWSIANGVASHDSSLGPGDLYQDFALTIGKSYKITIEITATDTTELYFMTDNGDYVEVTGSPIGVHSHVFVADESSHRVGVRGSGNWDGSVDNITLEELNFANHGTISGATWTHGIGSPVAQTAVIDWNKGTNYLEYSNNFTHSSWQKLAAGGGTTPTITADYTTGPTGENDASRLQASSTGTGVLDYSLLQFELVSAATDVSAGIWVKSNTGSNQTVYFRCNATDTTSSATVTTEWTRIEKEDSSAANIYNTIGLRGAINGTIDISIWGASLEKTANVGPYVYTNGTAQTSPVLLPQGLTSGRDITGVNLFENVRKQGALNLDGNSWAEVHDNASLDITTAVTLEAWVYWDSTQTAKGILGKWNSSSTQCYLIYVASSSRAQFYTSTTGSNAQSVEYTIPSDGWVHIVGTDDGTNQKLYINGAEEATRASLGSIFANDRVLEIGRYNEAAIRQYPNDIAQPRIYNRALTAEEVERNYNAGKNIYK